MSREKGTTMTWIRTRTRGRRTTSQLGPRELFLIIRRSEKLFSPRDLFSHVSAYTHTHTSEYIYSQCFQHPIMASQCPFPHSLITLRRRFSIQRSFYPAAPWRSLAHPPIILSFRQIFKIHGYRPLSCLDRFLSLCSLFFINFLHSFYVFDNAHMCNVRK